MGRKLRATVHVRGITHYAGDEPSEDVAALITNPDAWEVAPKQAKTADPAPESDTAADVAPEDAQVETERRPRGNRRSQN
jgi:hypothetical protein